MLSFDGNLDSLKFIFKKVGKIRKFITGETMYCNKAAFFCIVIFKYEFDLVKCFRDDYFQEIANRSVEGARPNEE